MHIYFNLYLFLFRCTMFHKQLWVLLSVAIFSCHVFLPLVEAGHHHGNNQEGLAVLLAAGLLAKILKGHHKHEEHHIHIPVHHEEHKEHHGHHGSGTTRIIVHHPPPPFHNIHGGMLPAPSMMQNYFYPPAPYGYPSPPY